MFIIIDGDDIGRRITSSFISNDENGLTAINRAITIAVNRIADLLRESGFRVIFCAADGVVAASDRPSDFNDLFHRVRETASGGVTFSAGVGDTLQHAFLALTQAKSTGKDRLIDFAAIGSE